MAILWIHDAPTPSGARTATNQHGCTMYLDAPRPFALSPRSYYEQPYPRRAGVFREAVEVKREEQR